VSSEIDPEDGRREEEIRKPDPVRDGTLEDDGITQYQALGSGVVQRVSKSYLQHQIILDLH